MVSIDKKHLIFQVWQKSLSFLSTLIKFWKFFGTEASSALLHFPYFSRIDYFSCNLLEKLLSSNKDKNWLLWKHLLDSSQIYNLAQGPFREWIMIGLRICHMVSSLTYVSWFLLWPILNATWLMILCFTQKHFLFHGINCIC